MADTAGESSNFLRVRLDDDLRQDLARAETLTNIRNQSDLVRYAVRQLVITEEGRRAR